MEKKLPVTDGNKKTIVFDFDGVIHSYKSGWKGETIIPDAPVPGIRQVIHDLRKNNYRVVVVSTRCNTEAGKSAVYKWLMHNLICVDAVQAEKPPALVYVDDRAICFDGDVSTLFTKIVSFRPWTYTNSK